MRRKEKHVLIGAQSWAFGPAGKASAVGHSLQKMNIKTCFVGSSTSFDLCRNSGHFDDLIKVSSVYDYLKLQKDDFFAVVSVMDPYLAVWAINKNLPLYYVDSMSWFWNWEDNENAKIFIKNLGKKELIDSFRDLDSFPPDVRQLIAHQISQLIFSQGKPQTILETKKKAENVGSVIDLSYKESSVERDTIIISLSGGISPATNLESAVRYANMVVNLVLNEKSPVLSLAKKILITGHSEVIKRMNKSYPIDVELKSLTHPDFLTALNRAIVVFIPCGFTTVYEALAYRVPVVFLPENHNGHVYEYLIITDNLADKESIFPNTLFTLSLSSLNYIRPIDDSMSLINIHTREYINNIHYQENYKQKMNKVFSLLLNREEILKKQTSAILKLIPDFEGADRIAKIISSKLLEQN